MLTLSNPDDPGWEWFWGTATLPTPEEAQEILAHGTVLQFDGGLAFLTWNTLAKVANLHTYIEPTKRGSGLGLKMIREALERAQADGAQKVVASIAAGNPWYPDAGCQHGPCGFELEATLRRQTFVAGKIRDLYMYGRFFPCRD